MKPQARAGLITRRVGEEVVVYDPGSHTAHCLNRTAALVFDAAQGEADVAGLADRLSEQQGSPIPEDVVRLAVTQLAEANLLDLGDPSREEPPSRRQVLRRVGIGMAVLTPAVVSLLVPTPAEALNTCIPHTACTTTNPGQPCWQGSTLECVNKQCTGNVGECL
jgi:hypothetical protein